MLFRLRYRSTKHGVTECLHRIIDQSTPAAAQARAEASARAWCNSEPGRAFILTVPAIEFDDSNVADLDAAQADDAARTAKKKGAAAVGQSATV